MIFDKLFEQRANLENPSTSLSDPAAWLFHAFGAQPSSANVSVNEQSALQITAFWSAVNTIADTLGELPVKLVQHKKNGEQKVITQHPALRLIKHNPNDMMSSIVYRSTLQSHSLVWGNGYSYIERNQLQEPFKLWPLAPQNTRPVIKNRELYFDTTIEGENVRIQSSDMIHIPALSRNGVEGMSVIREQREMLGASIASQTFGARFFANGARPGGLISFPGKILDPAKIRTEIEKQSAGDNQHRTMVLDGDAKYQQFAVPPDDAQFLQTREFSVDEVARMFRLPLHFLNKMGQATFNNLEMMGSHFVQYTMMPWLVRWEQELTRKLLTESEQRRGYTFKFSVQALIRGDIKTRSEVYRAAVTNGWMTRNEVRALEDMNPLDGLDDPLIPLNLGVVGEEPPEPEPAPEPDPEPESEVDDTDEENEDDQDEQASALLFTIAAKAAERCASKEAYAVRRIVAKHSDLTELADALAEFYTRHRELLADNLSLSDAVAENICQRHAQEIAEGIEADQVEDVLIRWRTEDAANIAAQVTRQI